VLAKAQPKVALLRCDSSIHDTAFLSVPSYLSQTDTFGHFEMKNIRAGTYDIFAFIDANNDNRLTSAKEKAFAPTGKRFELINEIGPFALYEIQCDSSTKKLAGLKPMSATLLIGQWEAGAHAPDSKDKNFAWRIEAVDTSDTADRIPGIASHIPIKRSMRFALQLDAACAMQSYLLIYAPDIRLFIPDSIDSIAEMVRDTIRFNGTIARDTLAPSLTSVSPTGAAALLPRIALAWSEPVRAIRTNWTLADTLGDTLDLICDTLFTDTAILALPRRLLPDRRYSLWLDDSSFIDLSGNYYIDTSDTPRPAITFNTIAGKNLCMSISGGSKCLDPDANRFWRFMPLGSRLYYQCKDDNATFRFDSIPAAKGTLAHYIDSNGDEKPTEGNLFPWRAPEPYFLAPDTVEARARWDIEGISIAECEPCMPPTPQPGADTAQSADSAKTEKKQ
jgi:hypothetical protein